MENPFRIITVVTAILFIAMPIIVGGVNAAVACLYKHKRAYLADISNAVVKALEKTQQKKNDAMSDALAKIFKESAKK